MKIEVGNSLYSQNDKGDWIWKAKTPTFITPKPKHIADKPHHLALQQAIDEEKKEYSQTLSNTVIEIANYLKDISNDNQ